MAKAQSAMEYLMTYGWTILIIAVVIAVLFSLGVFNFNSGAVASGSCVAKSGFLCKTPVMASNGLLSATVGSQVTLLSSVQTGCATGTGVPASWSGVQASTINLGGSATLNFSCPLASNVLGASFTGTLWIEYTQNGQTIESPNRSINAKATQVAITSSPPITYSQNGATTSGSSISTTLPSAQTGTSAPP